MSTSIKLLVVDQLDERLPALRDAAESIRRQVPRTGWIKAIGNALGISERSFAKRLGIQHSSLHKLERNERSGSITLESLRRAAEALDADLVYAIVPRKPLRVTIRDRAHALALERLRAIAQSMALEEQSLTAKQLEQKPASLWR